LSIFETVKNKFFCLPHRIFSEKKQLIFHYKTTSKWGLKVIHEVFVCNELNTLKNIASQPAIACIFISQKHV